MWQVLQAAAVGGAAAAALAWALAVAAVGVVAIATRVAGEMKLYATDYTSMLLTKPVCLALSLSPRASQVKCCIKALLRHY